jgi:UDP-glucose 4-epimerase
MVESILVTGGTGYIGSHACVALINAGYHVIILDNLSNSSSNVLKRLNRIVGLTPHFIHGDIRDRSILDKILADNNIFAVMHFAGLKAVGESVEKPLAYYDNNIRGTIELLSAMKEAKVRTLVFSSSCTVYGDPEAVPIRENSPRSATSPYGRSKLIIEDILDDLYKTNTEWNIARLRYFNPVGAHPSGLIGEDPKGIPNNLMPYISQVAVGRREKLNIYGDDYPTPDGTGVRDYIHVMDVADGHVSALRYCQEKGGMLTVNFGTGKGSSVLQMIHAFEKASSRPIPYEIVARRAGDIAQCWADPSLAFTKLGWKATRGLSEMCEDSWRWQKNNPGGYD